MDFSKFKENYIMKTDSMTASLIWGRNGAAVLCLVSFLLQMFGIEFGEGDQAMVNEKVGGILAALAGIMALISKWREQKKVKTEGGFAVWPVLVVLAVIGLASLTGIGFIGCAPNQSATQQLAQQTGDPVVIALGTYADALEAYIAAQETYLPYQKLIQQKRPEVDAKVKGYFKDARKVLNKWKTYGSVMEGDKANFRATLREISLAAAAAIDEGRAK